MNEDARLMHWLSSHRGEAASGADPSAHVDVDTLTRHATGRLSPAQAHSVTEHLLVCEDGRCVEFLRAQASDVDAATDFLYPPGDERASAPRTFQCRDALWDMINEVATHTGLPVDEVINDAMLQYAHSRGYHEGPTARRPGDESPLEATQDAAAFIAARSSSQVNQMRRQGSITTTAVGGDEDLSESEPSARGRGAAMGSITAQRSPALTPEAVPRAPPSVRNPAARPFAMPPPQAAAPPPPMSRRMPAPPGAPPLGAPPPRAAPPSARAMAPPPSRGSLAPPSSRRAPPPLPSASHMPIAPPPGSMGSMSLSKRLVLTYLGQTYDVDKEHFIIGRSKNQADLRVDDANVSRQHAAIERIGSIYYLVDLGSTNGVYVGDDRVTRRALADGDTIIITTHRISCRLG